MPVWVQRLRPPVIQTDSNPNSLKNNSGIRMAKHGERSMPVHSLPDSLRHNRIGHTGRRRQIAELLLVP